MAVVSGTFQGEKKTQRKLGSILKDVESKREDPSPDRSRDSGQGTRRDRQGQSYGISASRKRKRLVRSD